MRKSDSNKTNLEAAKEKNLTDEQIGRAYTEANQISNVPILRKNAQGFYDIFFDNQWREFEQEKAEGEMSFSSESDDDRDNDEYYGIGSDLEEAGARMRDAYARRREVDVMEQSDDLENSDEIVDENGWR